MATSEGRPKKAPPKPEYRVVNRKIVRLRKVRFAVPGKPARQTDGTPPPPGVVVLVQHWIEVEWPEGEIKVTWKRYKVRTRWGPEWVWNNPSHNRNNPHLPKHLTDEEVTADLARILFKGDRERSAALVAELLEL